MCPILSYPILSCYPLTNFQWIKETFHQPYNNLVSLTAFGEVKSFLKIQIYWDNSTLFIVMIIVILTELQQVCEAGFPFTEDMLTLSQ